MYLETPKVLFIFIFIVVTPNLFFFFPTGEKMLLRITNFSKEHWSLLLFAHLSDQCSIACTLVACRVAAHH